MKTYTKESLAKALQDIRAQGWIESKRRGNDGGIGNTLEDLLGIPENNLPIPNAAEWELKSQKKNTTALITLFHMEPSPRAYKFVPNILLPNFGWAHQKAGARYPIGEMSFRQTIRATTFSSRGFSVAVDRKNEKVLVVFDPKKIDGAQHPDWAQVNLTRELSPQPYWGFQDLFHKAGTKLHNCFFVRATTKKEKGQVFFRYDDIYMLKGLDMDRLINAIEQGFVYIDFDARTGHNHGTKFRLQRNALLKLYAEVKEF